jgi:hypothetical protein
MEAPALRPTPPLIVWMSFRLAIPRRVALQCWAAEAGKAGKELEGDNKGAEADCK